MLYGHEIEGKSAQRASDVKEINLKIGVLQENDYPTEFFDAITMYHVLEHVENPRQY